MAEEIHDLKIKVEDSRPSQQKTDKDTKNQAIVSAIETELNTVFVGDVPSDYIPVLLLEILQELRKP